MDPILIVPILIVLLVVLFVVYKRQKAGGRPQSTKKNSSSKSSKSSGKTKNKGKTSSVNKKNNISKEKKPVAASTTKVEKPEPKKTTVSQDWDWNSTTSDETTVSVATVDHLTEYKVYKQFGYFQKAAESLATYLEQNASSQSEAMVSTLAAELADLCIQAKDADKLCEVIDVYRHAFDQPSIENLIRQGLGLDENHLGLRVLAEDLLHWDVKETEKEAGIDHSQMPDEHVIAEDALNEQDADQALEPLVEGYVGHFNIRGDEREVILSFSKPENSYALLKEQLPYDAAIRCLNKAIKTSKKPAGLIIDALALDYRHNSINVFAQHLWNLYYSLGKYGNKVKERMLGWGYSLGQHPMFEELEKKPGETVLRDIGINQGYLPVNSSALKAKRLPLVENSNSGNDVGETPGERVLHDVKSLLTYGQFDESMDLLEKSVLLYPQESQLYITLFDLYERAEEWGRLEKMLQSIRTEIQTPPEEVVLAMSQLLQRINHGGMQSS